MGRTSKEMHKTLQRGGTVKNKTKKEKLIGKNGIKELKLKREEELKRETRGRRW